jgi:predicted amidohydrolase YtcJ
MTLAGNVLFPKFEQNEIRPMAKRFLDYWASFGYTSIDDPSGSAAGRMLQPEMLKDMERDGELPVRVNYLYTFSTLEEIDDALQYVGKDTEQVRFLGLKIFVDGAYAGGQAWTSWENQKGNHGLNYVYTDDSQGENYSITRIVEKADLLKLDVHYHVQGDMAIGGELDPLLWRSYK